MASDLSDKSRPFKASLVEGHSESANRVVFMSL